MALTLPSLFEGVAKAIMPKQTALQGFDTKPQNPANQLDFSLSSGYSDNELAAFSDDALFMDLITGNDDLSNSLFLS